MDACEKQLEIAEIIDGIKSIDDFAPGYHDIFKFMSISSEGMTGFLNLLSPNEFMEGYINGGQDSVSEEKKESEIKNYYITLGNGIVLELHFIKSEYFLRHRDIITKSDYTKSEISCSIFVSSEDLKFNIHTKYGWPRLQIVDQSGEAVFEANATEEYIDCNGKKVNEFLKSVSAEELVKRFASQLHRTEGEVTR